MTILFDAEGKFREVPDPPPKPAVKRYSCFISHGPSFTELFQALKSYPKRKVIFEISPRSLDNGFQFLSCAHCEIFVSGMRVLLMPMQPGQEITIEAIENQWLLDGFAQTAIGFKAVSLCYNTKDRDGYLYFSLVEEFSKK